MSDLINLVSNLSFEDVKIKMKSLNISVKQNENLYMLNFNNDADFSNLLVRQANGTIFEKDTNKLVHFSFEKSYDGISSLHKGEDTCSLEIIPEEYKVELFFEGSLIKIYWYNEKWNLATSKNIEASKNKWTSSKSFDLLFEDGVRNSFVCEYDDFLKSLDKNYCYTYLLQHPENKMTVPISTAFVFEINKVNLHTLEETREESENFKINISLQDFLEKGYKTNCILYFKNERNTVTRVKLLTDRYIRMSNLRGCYPDIGLTYINLLHLGVEEDINDFKEFFQHHAGKFSWIELLISRNVKYIHSLYVKKYAEKSENEIPELYRRTLQQLHGYYKRTKTPIKATDVYIKLMSYNPKLICSIIGYIYDNN